MVGVGGSGFSAGGFWKRHMVPAFSKVRGSRPVVEQKIFAVAAVARQQAALRGAKPAKPAQRQFIGGQGAGLDPPGAARRNLRPKHGVKERGDPRHAALHAARAPAPGDPQAAALFGGAEPGLRIAVELGDIGKALQRRQRQQRRRPFVELAVDLGAVLGPQVGGDVGEIAQGRGDDADGHEAARV